MYITPSPIEKQMKEITNKPQASEQTKKDPK